MEINGSMIDAQRTKLESLLNLIFNRKLCYFVELKECKCFFFTDGTKNYIIYNIVGARHQ